MKKESYNEVGPGGEGIFEEGDNTIYDPGFNFEFKDAISNAIDLANQLDKKIILRFNDIDLEVTRDSDAIKIEKIYFDIIDEKRKD